LTNRYPLAGCAAALFCTAAEPAFATLSAVGAVDPTSALTTFVSYLMGFAGLVFICIFVFKGIQAATDGRHFGPAAAALIGGVLLCFGGYYILTRLGVT
jgi:uncharacterized membrane protein YdcZ (DUF606 family)